MRLSRAHHRLRKARRNWQHQVTRLLANKAQVIVIEDLNTKGMTKSAKGTKRNPGRNVRAKTGLNREKQKTSWGVIKQMLEYKACEVILVNPAFTSQTCSECGVEDKRSRTSQSKFKCVACCHAQNADLNAARNILVSGTGTAARGGALGLPTPVNREIDTDCVVRH